MNNPTNSTQVEGSSSASSNHSLELSRIGGPRDHLERAHDAAQVSSVHLGGAHDAAHATSVQPEDMVLTAVVSNTSMHVCDCGKECTR